MNRTRRRRLKANLIAQFGPVCVECRQSFELEQLTLDHVVPLNLGGCDCRGNLQLMCSPCNSEKGHVIGRRRHGRPGHARDRCPGPVTQLGLDQLLRIWGLELPPTGWMEVIDRALGSHQTRLPYEPFENIIDLGEFRIRLLIDAAERRVLEVRPRVDTTLSLEMLSQKTPLQKITTP